MTHFPEWNDRKILIDLRNRFATCYENPDGSIFYIEPQYYTYLQGYKRLHPDRYQDLLDRMDQIVAKNRRVVFVGQEDNPLVDDHDAIYLTAMDVADSIGVVVDDQSNPDSDWKD